MIREAVVAGSFYAQDTKQLRQSIATWWPSSAQPSTQAIAAMAPHAGYSYSGQAAAQTLSLLPQASTAIILGPNHTGRGTKCAVSDADAWETPLGQIPVNIELATQLVDQDKTASFNNEAHEAEHSIEVLLPFLQYGQIVEQIVPICVSLWHYSELRNLGACLAEIVKTSSESILMITSSDMNHFANLSTTEMLDKMALKEIISLNAERLMKTVTDYDISMCGVSPMIAMMVAVSQFTGVQARLITHTTSAKMSGDRDRVVGYAGVLIEKK